jgi:hypothetical protein
MQPPTEKMMLTLLQDSKAPILEHYTQRGTTVNNVYYKEMLWDRLRPASLTENQGMVKKVLHCCMIISTYILPSTLFTPPGQMNFKVLGHPLLSPDLAP